MMDLAAIFHQARVPMCCALDQDTLQITLRTGPEVDSVQLIYADPYEAGIAGGEESWEGRRMAMQPSFRLEHSRLWQAVLRPPYRRLRYCFALQQGQETWYYYEDGLRPVLQLDARVQCFAMPWMNPADCIAPPDWVRHTVWYQIFPDRFCRGGSGRTADQPWRKGPVTNAQRFGGIWRASPPNCPIWPGWGSAACTSTLSFWPPASTSTTRPTTPASIPISAARRISAGWCTPLTTRASG